MDSALGRWVGLTWWGVFPVFLAIVAAFTRDRMCLARLTLLPSIATRPTLAWLVACMYLAAHVWLLVAYVATALYARDLIPNLQVARAGWRRDWRRVLAMILLMAIEYAPASIWVRLGRAVCH